MSESKVTFVFGNGKYRLVDRELYRRSPSALYVEESYQNAMGEQNWNLVEVVLLDRWVSDTSPWFRELLRDINREGRNAGS